MRPDGVPWIERPTRLRTLTCADVHIPQRRRSRSVPPLVYSAAPVLFPLDADPDMNPILTTWRHDEMEIMRPPAPHRQHPRERGPSPARHAGHRRHHQHGLDVFPASCIGLREILIFFFFFFFEIAFDRADAAHKAAALACLRDSDLVDDAVKEGYCQYRMHLALMGQVAATYGWNDGALMKSNKRLKDALDPSGSLVPGRCGIWRRRYRGHGLEMKRESGGRSEGDAVDPAEQPV